MDSTDPRELRSAGEPDDETMAAKERSRRVSFAETTAVHVFDRDEDFETPPTSAEAPSDSDESKGSAPEEDDNDDEEAEQEPFVRDMDSSSPGSAVGSVTSNDDDNFFGPVSASFIKSGRLSESGMSDDNNNNHDITLDSTAFSLHFRNIVPSDDRTANSAGSIRTPTRETLPVGPREFEANTGSTAGKSNNSMSLIVENPRQYDFGNTPPTLEAILAEVNKSVKDEMHIASAGKVDDSNAGPGVLATTVVNPSSSEETKTDIMEGILDKLQMARKYERLCTSLKDEEHLGDPKQRRISESRFLQDKLLFERAKLQLNRWKLDLLSSKAKLSQSGVRVCLNLKSKFSQLRTLDTRACQIQLGCIHFDSTHSNSTYQEEQRNNLLSKKQELEILDQKVKCLKKSFKASCRIKGNLENDEILKVVNEHLEMRKHCMIVRQDLQLWELRDIVKTNEQTQLVLNYQNFVLLRFTINTSQGSIIVVDNLLNDTNIEKSFPKMNASVAFAFIFKTEGARRLASSKCFQQETLVASLLLGTVLDVLGEINASRRELLNLIDSGFHSECSSQLELHICFLNFKRAWKVTLSLDVTELNCAIYPSKASELHFRIISGDQTTMPISVLDKITGAIQSLQDGQLMILRLCRCISKVVHALS